MTAKYRPLVFGYLPVIRITHSYCTFAVNVMALHVPSFEQYTTTGKLMSFQIIISKTALIYSHSIMAALKHQDYLLILVNQLILSSSLVGSAEHKHQVT